MRPSKLTLATCVLAAGVVFFAHESSAIAFGIIAGGFALVRGRSPAGLALRMTPAVVVLGLVVVQWRVSGALMGANMRGIGTYFGPEFGDRIDMLPGAVFGGLGTARLSLVAGIAVLALVASALGARGGRGGPWRAVCWRRRYALLAALFFLLFLSFPMGVGGATLVAHRFVAPACVCLVVACAAQGGSRAVIALSVAAPLAMLGAEAKEFAKADRSYRALNRVIALVPKDVAVAQLDLTPRAPSRVAPVPGAASRVQAERGGRMLFAMTDMPPNPVYVPAELQWNEPMQRLASAPYAFMPAHDLTRFAYLLVRDENATMEPLVAQALAPEAELVASEAEWALFQSRLRVVPLTVRDEALPNPLPETLAVRVNRLSAATPR